MGSHVVIRSRRRRRWRLRTAIRYGTWLTRSCRWRYSRASGWRSWCTVRRSVQSSPYRRTCIAAETALSCDLSPPRSGSARSANTCEPRTVHRRETTPADCLRPETRNPPQSPINIIIVIVIIIIIIIIIFVIGTSQFYFSKNTPKELGRKMNFSLPVERHGCVLTSDQKWQEANTDSPSYMLVQELF